MADTFVPASRLAEADRVYPLVCDLCERCGQVQSRTITDPAERYADYDYSYTSSNSHTSRGHWIEYAATVANRIGLRSTDAVVEIGSNDGFLMQQFQKIGCECLGVDASPAMAALAAQHGVPTVTAVFGESLAEPVERALGRKPRLIAANNVFNHANEPLDFALGIKALLAKDGIFVFELPYWVRSIADGKFDQIYHEHVSYFTVRYTAHLFRSIGMHVHHVEEVDYHGGSIRVFVGHGSSPGFDPPQVASVAEFVDKETRLGVFQAATYATFRQRIADARHRFLRDVYDLKVDGHSLVCIGAAAKGNTFLNYYNLDASVIDCVTDCSPSKIGKYTPRTRIPIRDDQSLLDYGPVHAIILSWNISTTLQESLKKVNPQITFLNPYFP